MNSYLSTYIQMYFSKTQNWELFSSEQRCVYAAECQTAHSSGLEPMGTGIQAAQLRKAYCQQSKFALRGLGVHLCWKNLGLYKSGKTENCLFRVNQIAQRPEAIYLCVTTQSFVQSHVFQENKEYWQELDYLKIAYKERQFHLRYF